MHKDVEDRPVQLRRYSLEVDGVLEAIVEDHQQRRCARHALHIAERRGAERLTAKKLRVARVALDHHPWRVAPPKVDLHW